MSRELIRDLVREFFARGGQITMCPTRVALGSPQLRHTLLPPSGFMAMTTIA